MRVCSPVVLSYLDAGFEPRCGRKDFLSACCCCLLLLLAAAAKTCSSSLDPKRWCKTSTGSTWQQRHIWSKCTHQTNTCVPVSDKVNISLIAVRNPTRQPRYVHNSRLDAMRKPTWQQRHIWIDGCCELLAPTHYSPQMDHGKTQRRGRCLLHHYDTYLHGKSPLRKDRVL